MTPPLLRAALAALAALALGSCAVPPRNQAAIEAPRTLVGLTKAELLSCAGAPMHSRRIGDAEVLEYEKTRVWIERDVDWDRDPWDPYGIRRRPEVRIIERRFTCEAAFTLDRGRVTDLRYNPGRDIELCWELIGNCLKPAR